MNLFLPHSYRQLSAARLPESTNSPASATVYTGNVLLCLRLHTNSHTSKHVVTAFLSSCVRFSSSIWPSATCRKTYASDFHFHWLNLRLYVSVCGMPQQAVAVCRVVWFHVLKLLTCCFLLLFFSGCYCSCCCWYIAINSFSVLVRWSQLLLASFAACSARWNFEYAQLLSTFPSVMRFTKSAVCVCIALEICMVIMTSEFFKCLVH